MTKASIYLDILNLPSHLGNNSKVFFSSKSLYTIFGWRPVTQGYSVLS